LIVRTFESEAPHSAYLSPAYKLIPVGEAVLEKYYTILGKHMKAFNGNGTCVDAGEFALISPSFMESLRHT